jgi:hypothetical protein
VWCQWGPQGEGGDGTHLDENVPIPVVVERVRVGDLELSDVAATVAILSDELLVWVGTLGVLVEVLHVGVRRGRVEVVVDLLDVLSVVLWEDRRQLSARRVEQE